uniref:Adhesin domain-containing protein n=1 Tax=Streptomyces sp. NBC_01393 TaxID=2903851 RepID=A0AAU3HTI1_9ACTN
MQKFDTPAPVSAVLDIPAGRIRFIAADRADTTVEVLPADASKGRDVKAAELTEVSYADGVLRVEMPEARNRSIGSSGSVEVTVQLPAGSRVEAKAAAAEFRGVGRLGDVAFEGGHRSVELDEADSVRLTGLDADITVGRLNGSGEISTQKGDLNVVEAARGTLTLSTLKGDITVGAAPGVSATLDAGTTFGRVSNTLKNADATPGLTIHATTAHGDITARTVTD